LLVVLFSQSVPFLACTRHPAGYLVVQEDWEQDPALALRLSEIISTGMRYVMSNLLLSDIWFEDLEITLASKDGVILDALVTSFRFSKAPPADIFAEWRVFRNIDFEIELMSTVSFASPDTLPGHPGTLAAGVDSLFLDVYQRPNQIGIAPDENPTIDLTFWRNKKKHDKIVVLKMERKESGKLHIHEAELP